MGTILSLSATDREPGYAGGRRRAVATESDQIMPADDTARRTAAPPANARRRVRPAYATAASILAGVSDDLIELKRASHDVSEPLLNLSQTPQAAPTNASRCFGWQR
jgi:hypothetical protein